MDRQERFVEIYNTNEFKGENSLSGPGSELKQTETLRKELIRLCKNLSIKVLIDAPCGDFNWMKEVLPQLNLINYLGVDIVPELIENIARKHGAQRVNFAISDITKYPYHPADLLLCRDCLVHLSQETTFKFLKHFSKFDIRYLLTTTFTKQNRKNFDFEDGTNWYPIDLCKEPFNLPQPFMLINENCQEENGNYSDKCLGLWSTEQIRGVFK